MYVLETNKDLKFEQLLGNPLLEGILAALAQIDELKKSARDYYFQVMLCKYPCPVCGGRLRMNGPSRCTCKCGMSLDPTVEFQPCPECGGKLALKYFHYACARCQKVVPSRFLFDERAFSAQYFCQKMAECRERKQRRLAEMRCWLATSRSDALPLDGDLSLESVSGLDVALDEFIGAAGSVSLAEFLIFDSFYMEDYRRVILAGLDECRLFSRIPPLCEVSRRDRARRFTTLVFMQHEYEVDLIQYGNDLWVMRHEADAQGC